MKDKIIKIAKAIWTSPKVRLAFKGLVLAAVAVVGDEFGAGELVSNILSSL